MDIFECETLDEASECVKAFRIEFETDENKTELNDEEFTVYMLAFINRQDLLNKCRWVVIEGLIKDGYLRENKYGISVIVPDEATEVG